MTFGPAKLPSPPPGWFDYRYYVLSDGALAILRADRDVNTEYRAWWEKARTGTFRQKMPDLWMGSARLSTFTESGESASISVPLVRFPELDRFPDGRWLLASSRAKLGEHNGIIVEAEGRVSSTLPLGDAIAQLRCAPDGSIWIGYFDEGIFGDDLGAGGIAHFNARGERLWSFNDGKQVGDSLVFDCYALSLDGNELWSCFYNDFPIVRVADGRETVWANTAVAGAKALAVDGSSVLLAGGYRADANRLALLNLAGRETRLLGSYEQPEIENAALISGRSSVIHVVNNGMWTRISIEEVRQHLTS